MGTPHPPEQALLFSGFLYSDKNVFREVLSVMRDRFGSVLMDSPELEWNHSHYYSSELGEPIFRRFIFFDQLFDASTLPSVKLETNSIESLFSVQNKRKINIDPGYITSSKVVLASAKDYSHRLYIGSGIYGEVALYYHDNRFNPMYYTYQDYRDAHGLQLFESARKQLKRLIKTATKSPDYHGELLRPNI